MKTILQAAILGLSVLCAATTQAQYGSGWSEFNSGNSVSQTGAAAHRGVIGGWLRRAVQSANYTMMPGNPLAPMPVPVVGAPLLTIVPFGSDVRISWPTSAADFVLESTSDLPGGLFWSLVPGPYQSNVAEWFLVLSPSEERQFFRLRREE